uniref:Uncharacterized protein n=1 Tax=Rhizophora mucronata TaxID=61149 RepID=A0A2P2PSF6_RHIMU
MRFHKRMRLQKLESFKRYQEMLARGVLLISTVANENQNHPSSQETN